MIGLICCFGNGQSARDLCEEKKKIGKKKRKSSISMAVFKTFWPLSREPLVQLAQFKACWMRNFQDIKLVGQSKLCRGPEVARGPEFEYHWCKGLNV